MINFKKEESVDSNEDQVDMDPDPDEEDMEDARLDEKIVHHWRMVFDDNDGGVDEEKVVLNDRCYVYM